MNDEDRAEARRLQGVIEGLCWLLLKTSDPDSIAITKQHIAACVEARNALSGHTGTC